MKINFRLPLFPQEDMNTGSKVGGKKHIKINACLLGPPTEKCPHQNGSPLLSLLTGRTPGVVGGGLDDLSTLCIMLWGRS